MNASIDNQEYLNRDITLTIKDEKFYLRVQELGLLVKGDNFSSTYEELMQKKEERIKIMKELNINIPVNQSKSLASGISDGISTFFLKLLIVVIVLMVMGGIVFVTLDGIMEKRIVQLDSSLKKKTYNFIDIIQHQIVPYYVDRVKNVKPINLLEEALYKEAEQGPMELERQERIVKSIRVVVQRLKPFMEEIRPLLKNEK
jgi:hypothetical protein